VALNCVDLLLAGDAKRRVSRRRGHDALDEDGRALWPGDTYAETKDSLKRALAAERRLGTAREEVVRMRIYLTPEADWRAAARALGEIFRGAEPANTTLFVAGLILEWCVVEVELDAVAS
jgi:enamine deaminase RidA (YjgF/YER057c/UK114 family)